MLFCACCNNILIMEKQQCGSVLACKSCPYTHKILKNITKKTYYQTKQADRIMGGKDEFKYASTCEKKCPTCDYNKALFIEMQTRSADEPMTIFYECVKCSTVWKE